MKIRLIEEYEGLYMPGVTCRHCKAGIPHAPYTCTDGVGIYAESVAHPYRNYQSLLVSSIPVPFVWGREWNRYGRGHDFESEDNGEGRDGYVGEIMSMDTIEADPASGRYSGFAKIVWVYNDLRWGTEEWWLELSGHSTLHPNGNGCGSWQWERIRDFKRIAALMER